MLCAVIMAGGIGSRFWPQSTPQKPKQFLQLLSDRTMIQMTYDRIRNIVPDDRIFIVTNRSYVPLVKEQLPNIRDINIICEPYSKNTAPCILLSSLYIQKIYPNTNIITLPSDSYVGDIDEFLKNIMIADEFVNIKKEAIVAFGITPTRPETNYGYIKYQKDDKIPNKVIRFVEKPNLELAKEYFASNEYLWNAGMYLFNNHSMLEEIKNNLPEEYQLLKDLPDSTDSYYNDFLDINYSKCQKISIDYAVMEKSLNIYTIPSNIKWDDVGSWEALERYTESDNNGNITSGNVKAINSHNNVIYGNGKNIILSNVDDLFCIDSDEVIIVGKKDDLKNVHLLKEEISKDI